MKQSLFFGDQVNQYLESCVIQNLKLQLSSLPDTSQIDSEESPWH